MTGVNIFTRAGILKTCRKIQTSFIPQKWIWITTVPLQTLSGGSNGWYNGLYIRLTTLNFIHLIHSICYIHIHMCMPSVFVLPTLYALHNGQWCTTFHRNTYLALRSAYPVFCYLPCFVWWFGCQLIYGFLTGIRFYLLVFNFKQSVDLFVEFILG